MAIKTTRNGGAKAGRGDQPYDMWHPSMGEPKTATGGGGKKPPKKPRTTTGGGKEPEKPSDNKQDGMHPYHVLPQKKVPREMTPQSDKIMKMGNVYQVPDSYWGNR